MRARAPFLGLIVVAALAPSPSARAQEALGADIGENLASGRSATDFTTRIRWRSGYLALDDTFELVLNRFSGTYAARDDFALRLQVPVSYLDPDRPGVSSEFGLGDISARVLWRMWDHPKVSGFLGVEHFFPTATDSSLGTEKFVVSPLVALFFPIHRRLVFIPVYQQLFSYAGRVNAPTSTSSASVRSWSRRSRGVGGFSSTQVFSGTWKTISRATTR